MAALTHFSKPYLSLVETGRRQATPDIVERYEHALGVPIGTPADPVRRTHEWLLDNPPATGCLRAGRRIGAALIRTMEARAARRATHVAVTTAVKTAQKR